MGRESTHSPFTGCIIEPEHETVLEFDPREGECCTAEEFWIDITDTETSDWNRSAARVFARDFVLQDEHYQFRDVALIEEKFLNHFKSLRKAYVTSIKSMQERRALQSAYNRYARKRTVCLFLPSSARRWGTRNPDGTNEDLTMLQRLGPNGMSSDETDYEQHGQYRMLKKTWRSLKLTNWLHGWDQLHRSYRTGVVGPVTRGNQPRWRFISNKVDDTRAPVTRLPRDAYSADWVAHLDDFTKNSIQAEDKDFGFIHGEAVEAYVHLFDFYSSSS
ncbi:hypothetical protein BV25DRAFT_1816684 [Artomyces pyxidatus]|uniref:Uncharacterized protein n=1 Tax=Artomyces pyxidatus TaxID=48021 RepID=A0ACB8SFB1_9AGAM|nr:hypothetical protein BV25DRAFT_1816684 [Artomyces pyxidatus]